jgi:hypothetical protein
MHRLLPGVAGALEVLGPQAVEPVHARIPGEYVVLHIPVPHTDDAGGSHLFQAGVLPERVAHIVVSITKSVRTPPRACKVLSSLSAR